MVAIIVRVVLLKQTMGRVVVVFQVGANWLKCYRADKRPRSVWAFSLLLQPIATAGPPFAAGTARFALFQATTATCVGKSQEPK
ncbi:MAG: hypothetical protein IT260_15210 [Saprospiraceae bacterium]|nr:hypothetical protein [Saprospiraceae bacterium]